MKILKSITNALTKAEEKRGQATVATLRQDTVRKAIERGEFEVIRCAYHMTDDYAWDAVNNFGQNDSVSAEAMANEYRILTPKCWVSPKILERNGIQCYEVSISFHSNLSYDMYVPVDGKKSEPVEEEKEIEAEESQEEKLYKRYDIQDEKDFSIETLDQMKSWLADFWNNNPDEDMDDEEHDNLIDGIWASTADELFERLAGIDYTYEEIEDEEKEILEEKTVYLCDGCNQTHETPVEFGACCKDKFVGAIPEKICYVYICNECDEVHGDETDVCDYCPSDSIRKVHKHDMDMRI